MSLFRKKTAQNQGSPKGTCVWVDEVGAIKLRVFDVIKSEEGKITINFENGEQYIIPKKCVRAKRVLIWNKSDGKIIVQNPDKWKDIDLKKHKIKELRFNLQNFALQESKASIHRWTIPKDTITKLSPLFKLLMICIVIGVIGWSAMKFGSYVLEVVMQSRVADCASVLPKTQIPIGTNLTAPIGS